MSRATDIERNTHRETEPITVELEGRFPIRDHDTGAVKGWITVERNRSLNAFQSDIEGRMSEMVERGAIALAIAIHGAAAVKDWPGGFERMTDTRMDADDLRGLARAVITSMREPTQQMGWAALQTGHISDEAPAGAVADIWRAMIDSAQM